VNPAVETVFNLQTLQVIPYGTSVSVSRIGILKTNDVDSSVPMIVGSFTTFEVEMKIAAICLMVIALAGIGAKSQERANLKPEGAAWRQIQLLRSKPEDVEKLLGQSSRYSGYDRLHSLHTYELFISYYPFDHCRPSYGYTGQWNIPEWTVTELTYVPAGSVAFSSLKVNTKDFSKAHESPHVPGMLSYVNDREGVDYTLEEDGKTLNSIKYFPPLRDQHLRCEENN
jgi:hypothetical protein